MQVDAIREPLAQALTGIKPRSSPVAFFSTVTGELMDTEGLDGDYWYRSIRHTVQFERAVRSACAAGHQVFIESSPHPVLIAAVEEACPIATTRSSFPRSAATTAGCDGSGSRWGMPR